MNGQEFYDHIKAHEDLEWLDVIEGSSPAEDEVVILHVSSCVKRAIKISSILEAPWVELEAVLIGRREPMIMIHLSRIVGYYSRMSNWNRSKIRELADRHNGQYSLPEVAA